MEPASNRGLVPTFQVFRHSKSSAIQSLPTFQVFRHSKSSSDGDPNHVAPQIVAYHRARHPARFCRIGACPRHPATERRDPRHGSSRPNAGRNPARQRSVSQSDRARRSSGRFRKQQPKRQHHKCSTLRIMQRLGPGCATYSEKDLARDSHSTDCGATLAQARPE
jgi:hypothetical protein